MNIRKIAVVRPFWLSFGLLLALSLSTPTALAQNAKVEATAKALQKKAMDEERQALDAKAARSRSRLMEVSGRRLVYQKNPR